MAEAGEGAPREITTAQKEHLQGLSSAVVLGERRGGIAGLPPQDQARWERARATRNTDKFSDSLRELAEISESSEDLVAKARLTVEQFGITRKADGTKNRIGIEKTRYDRADKGLVATEAFLTRGYANVDAAAQTQIRAWIEQRAANLPNFGQEFQRLSPTAKTAHIDQILADPQFKTYVKDQLEKLTTRTLTPDEDIIKAQRKGELAAHDGMVAAALPTDIQADLNRTRQALADLRGGAVRMSPDVINQLNQANAEIGLAKAAKTAAQKEFDDAKNARDQALNTAGTDKGLIRDARQVYAEESSAAQRKITTAQDTLTRQQTTIAQLNQLHLANQPKPTDYEQVIDTRRQQMLEAAREAVKMPFKEQEKRGVSKDIEKTRASEEEAYAKAVENIFANAYQLKTAADLQNAFTALEANEPEILSETTRQAREGFKKQLNARWERQIPRNRGILRGRKNEAVIDKRAVDRDFNQLLRTGPEAGIRAILTRIRPTPDGLRAPLTPDQINELMQDTQFVEGMSDQYMNGILSRRMLIQKIRPGEVHQIVNSSWGKEIIGKAIQTNQEYRSNLSQLIGSEDLDLDKTDVRSRFSKEVRKHPGLLLSAFLLAPVLAPPILLGQYFKAKHDTENEDERRDLVDQIAA